MGFQPTETTGVRARGDGTGTALGLMGEMSMP